MGGFQSKLAAINATIRKPRIRRHPVLSLLLGLMISIYLLFALILPWFMQTHPLLTTKAIWFILGMNAICIFNIGLLVAIVYWKKWAFYVYLAESLILFVLNVIVTGNILKSILGLTGIALLYGALQLGGEHKGWKHLK